MKDMKSKKWHATPYEHNEPVPHSDNSVVSAGKKMKGERTWNGATPFEHDAPTPKSKPESPKGVSKAEVLGPTYGPGSPMLKQPKSGEMNWTPASEHVHKSWKKRGYTVTGPVTQDFGSAPTIMTKHGKK